jgi:hypothetical protein
VTPKPFPLSDFKLRIDESKFGYLAREKAGTLKRIGLLDGSLLQLKKIIAAKLSSNYIYNMCHDDQYNTTKFDIVLEVHPKDAPSPVRILVALEYIPDEKSLRSCRGKKIAAFIYS